MGVQVKPLSIDGAWSFEPTQYADPRGIFFEWFRQDEVSEAIGHEFSLAQVNCSTSSAGVIRGIHYADVPPSQAKFVMCPAGAVLDVVVDLRVGSPTFGSHDTILLDGVDRRAVYIAEGLGHGFMALTESATVMYLCSTPYAPTREHGVDPLDGDLAIPWPDTGGAGQRLSPLLSEKDLEQPSLADARDLGLLPTMEDAQRLYASLGRS